MFITRLLQASVEGKLELIATPVAEGRLAKPREVRGLNGHLVENGVHHLNGCVGKECTLKLMTVPPNVNECVVRRHSICQRQGWAYSL